MNSAIATHQARRFSWLVLFVTVSVILVAGWILLAVLGQLFIGPSGKEFSPYTFNSRDFRIYRWFGGTVIQPSSSACSTEISKHLTNATRTDVIDRWDLVQHWKGIRYGIVDSEASILVDCFDALDHQNNRVWEKWSKENPGLAKILWPAVQQLAIHRAYFALPELLQFAATCPTPIKFQTAIDQLSQSSASDQAARHLAKKEFSDARIALEWAKSFGSTSELDQLEAAIRAGFASLSESKK